MKLKSKIVYGLIGLLGFLPLSILVIVQSVFALQPEHDSKLVINGEDIQIVDILMYDQYNNDITVLIDDEDEDGQPTMYSIQEATTNYLLIDFHGAKIDDERIKVSAIQFVLDDGSKTELLSGTVYLLFMNLDESDTWLQHMITEMTDQYYEYFQPSAWSISVIVAKVFVVSAGTLLGIITAILIIIRKSFKELAKRYWRISVLIGLAEATIILGAIAWIATDMFLALGSVLAGWAIFLGSEKLALMKGWLDTPTPVTDSDKVLISNSLEQEVALLLAKFRK